MSYLHPFAGIPSAQSIACSVFRRPGRIIFVFFSIGNVQISKYDRYSVVYVLGFKTLIVGQCYAFSTAVLFDRCRFVCPAGLTSGYDVKGLPKNTVELPVAIGRVQSLADAQEPEKKKKCFYGTSSAGLCGFRAERNSISSVEHVRKLPKPRDNNPAVLLNGSIRQ